MNIFHGISLSINHVTNVSCKTS